MARDASTPIGSATCSRDRFWPARPPRRQSQMEQALHRRRRTRVAAAFFDVDNTIMQGASIFHLARSLSTVGISSRPRDLVRGCPGSRRGSASIGSEDPEHIARGHGPHGPRVHRRAQASTELEEIGEEIFDEHMAAKIWPGQEPGRPMASRSRAIGSGWSPPPPSRSPRSSPAGSGLTGALGTVAEHVDGVYTGALVGEMLHGEGKAVAIREIAARESLGARGVLRLLRLEQRPADALARRASLRGQSRLRSCDRTPRPMAGGCATTAPAARSRYVGGKGDGRPPPLRAATWHAPPSNRIKARLADFGPMDPTFYDHSLIREGL